MLYLFADNTKFRPHPEYVLVIRYPKLRKHSQLIEATRIVKGCKKQSYTSCLKLFEVPTLEYRRAVNDMVEVYKYLHFYNMTSVPERFLARTCLSRNHTFELERIFAKDGLRGLQSNLFYFRVIQQWNALPCDVVDLLSNTIFKKRLNLAWKHKQFL